MAAEDADGRKNLTGYMLRAGVAAHRAKSAPLARELARACQLPLTYHSVPDIA